MKKIATLILFLQLVVAADAQVGRYIDSLENKLKTDHLPDSVTLKILNDLAYYYSSVDPEKGIKIADSAIDLSIAVKDDKELAAAYDYKGQNYASQGNDSIAIEWMMKAMKIHEKRHELREQAVILQNIGISYSNLSQYLKALECHRRAYGIFKKLDYKPGIAATLNSIGVVYLFVSYYPRALDYYQQALNIYEQMHDKQNIGVAYTNIGLVYHHALDYRKSLEYQLSAVRTFKETGNDYDLQKCLLNAGNVLTDSGNITQALHYYMQAEVINKKLGNKNGLASGLMSIGTAYFQDKDYSHALLYLKDALHLYRSINNPYGSGSTINYIVNTGLKADDHTLKEYGINPEGKNGELLELQRAGLKDGEVSGNLEIQRDGWENVSDIYLAKREPTRALYAYKKYVLFRDSIFNDTKRSEIVTLSLKYEFNKREDSLKIKQEKERLESTEEIKRQRIVKNDIMAGAGVVLFAGILSFIFYKRKHDAEEKKKEADLKAEAAEIETKALRSQMNPHFIFNSLNSISDYIDKHDTRTACDYLGKFAFLMRLTLENSEQKEIPLADDLNALELYMQLEALRMNHKFSYQITIADNIDQENTLVPPMILQPFVENSIWHGIAQKQGKGKILIEIKKVEDMISCVVEDNGVGMNKETSFQKHKKSLGMKITQSRIDLINRIWKRGASIHYVDLSEGMRVEMMLPLILNF